MKFLAESYKADFARKIEALSREPGESDAKVSVSRTQRFLAHASLSTVSIDVALMLSVAVCYFR